MKKIYTNPEINATLFDSENIVTVSGGKTGAQNLEEAYGTGITVKNVGSWSEAVENAIITF
ncbi:MAG: hypothetical protein ACI4DP_02360 [Candidatus Ornithomonoglobus sp.]